MTAVPFLAGWAGMAAALEAGWTIVYLLLLLPTAGLLVRLFMIQHDCGHGSFFPSRVANDRIGRLLGILTLTPYEHWRRNHAVHHASAGNLDRRGIGDVGTLTVDEYLARGPFGRLRYRLYRHPLVMFGLGPFYLFAIENRLPVGFMDRRAAWLSTMGTNLGFLAAAIAAVWLVGPVTAALVHGPVVMLAATIGVWLFFVQHQFEDTYWARSDEWGVEQAALHGSSHYDLPQPLRWFSGNIGLHHVHHLSSRIPFYRLPVVLQDFPELRDLGRLTIRDSLRCVRLVLWDERERRLISFRELAARAPERPAPAAAGPDAASPAAR